jgi:hypothetical protein
VRNISIDEDDLQDLIKREMEKSG